MEPKHSGERTLERYGKWFFCKVFIMSEKRKPVLTVIAYGPSKKKNKVELFIASDFRQIEHGSKWRQYRLRVSGKWFKRPSEKYSCFSIWEFRDIWIRSMRKTIDAKWTDRYKSLTKGGKK